MVIYRYCSNITNLLWKPISKINPSWNCRFQIKHLNRTQQISSLLSLSQSSKAIHIAIIEHTQGTRAFFFIQTRQLSPPILCYIVNFATSGQNTVFIATSNNNLIGTHIHSASKITSRVKHTSSFFYLNLRSFRLDEERFHFRK